MKNPYASPFARRVIAAFVHYSTVGAGYHPTKAARIATRYARILAWARALDHDGAPAVNSFWVRKSTGNIWRVWHKDGLVRVRLCRPPSDETEAFERSDFFSKFELYETA